MSRPSSSEDVQTTMPRRPALSDSSVSSRTPRESEPWCISTGRPDLSLRAEAMNSASPLLFANRRTGESSRSASMREAISDATSAADPGTYAISTSYRRTDRSRITRHLLRAPATNFAASAVLPTVADRPTRAKSRPEASASRSRLIDSCAPRSLASSSWTSSMTTHSRAEKAASMRSCTSMTTSDSGVVISTSGGRSAMRRRRRCGVSPCLTSTVRPAARAYAVTRRRTSRLRARRGVTYRAPTVPPGLGRGRARRARPRRSNMGTTAHSVLPEPVGATTSTSLFWRMAGEARRCISVSSEKPSDANAAARRPSGAGPLPAAPAAPAAAPPAATGSTVPAPAAAAAAATALALAAAAALAWRGLGGGARIAGIAGIGRPGGLFLGQAGPGPLVHHYADEPDGEKRHCNDRYVVEYSGHAVPPACAVK